MAKKFVALRAEMTTEARALAEQQTDNVLQEEASRGGAREDSDRFSQFAAKPAPTAGEEIAD